MERTGDILVIGTGPAGLVAALALAHEGFGVRLIGPPPRRDDRRTTAIMTPQLDYLAQLGVTQELERDAAPLRAMRIVDATKRLVRARPVTFRAAEIGESRFAINVENARLLAILEAAVAANARIVREETLVAGWSMGSDRIEVRLENGVALAAALAVAADGRRSPAREAAGIALTSRSTAQSALVLDFAHARDHLGVSTEFHTESGPFTQVPLPGRRSSLVWVLRTQEADAMARLDDAALSRRVEDRMQSMLGRVEVEPGRELYPLSFALPHRFAANRVALVGEAAHVFPPIGAQGLNLGIRDVEDLARILAGERDADPGAAGTLSRYDRRRRPDILARACAVDLLNRSLLSGMLPAQLARAAGLGLLGRLAPLRAFFMREGLRTGAGFRGALAGTGAGGIEEDA